MKKTKVKLMIAIVAILIVAIVGTLIFIVLKEKDKKDAETSSIKTYSKDNIEFQYPSKFKLVKDSLDEEGFEAIEDNDGNRFQFQKEKMPSYIGLADIVEREQKLAMPNDEECRTVVKGTERIALSDEIEGYRFESTTKDNAYQIIVIAQKDNIAYEFTFTINDKEKYEDNIEDADKIINSLKIK